MTVKSGRYIMASRKAHKASPVRSGPIRVLLANLAGVVAELMTQAIAQQQDMVLVGQVQGSVELLLAAQADVHIVVLGARRADPPPGICSHLLTEFPHLRVVVLARGGQVGEMYWLGLRRRKLRQPSTSSLTSVIREAYRLNATV